MYPGKRVGNFYLERRLGSGTYGEVWKVQDINTGGAAAMKLFGGSMGSEDYKNERNAYEVLSTKPYCDPYIVCMYGHGYDVSSGQYYIVQELMSGDLTDFTGWGGKEAKYRIRNAESMLLLMYQCVEGLRRMHEAEMVHSDIKPPNMLYNVPPGKTIDSAYFSNPENIRTEVCFKYGDPGLSCTSRDEKIRDITRIKRTFPNSLDPGRCKAAKTRDYIPSRKNVQTCELLSTVEYTAPDYYKSWNYRGEYGPYRNRMTYIQAKAGINFYKANDIWGVGLVFKSIIDGWESVRKHYMAQNQYEINRKRVNFKYGPPELRQAINNIINNMMLQYDFQKRKTALEIVNYILDVFPKPRIELPSRYVIRKPVARRPPVATRPVVPTEPALPPAIEPPIPSRRMPRGRIPIGRRRIAVPKPSPELAPVEPSSVRLARIPEVPVAPPPSPARIVRTPEVPVAPPPSPVRIVRTPEVPVAPPPSPVRIVRTPEVPPVVEPEPVGVAPISEFVPYGVSVEPVDVPRFIPEEQEVMDVEEYFPEEEVMDVEYFTVLVDPYSFNIDYDPNLTISDIKGYIFNATGIPVLAQNYIIIVDDIPYTVAFGTLAENNILPNTTLISIPI